MVNENIQGVIPLAGAGFIAKQKGNYQPGEYRRLNNVEIQDDGILIQRRNVHCTNASNETGVAGYQNVHGFIGYVGQYAVFTSAVGQWGAKAEESNTARTTLWAPTSLPVTGGGWHKLVDVFLYNGKLYWLSVKWDPTLNGGFGQTDFVVHSVVYNELAALSSYTYAGLTHTTVATLVGFSMYTTSFMQNDRFWIASSKRLFFSKATDPTIFAVPDGGFFNFPDTGIKWATSLRDNIYVFCDSSIHIVNYTADPNEDASVRRISDNVGADMATIHKDTPYFVNAQGVWAINGTFIEKVVGNIFEMQGGLENPQIFAFEDYIIITQSQKVNYDKVASFNNNYFYNLGRWYSADYQEGQESTANVAYVQYWINTDTGAVHTVDFRDAPEIDTQSSYPVTTGYVVDMIVNPNKNFFGNYALMLLTNRYVSDLGASYNYKAQVFFMTPNRETFVFDTTYNAAGDFKRIKPRIHVEIDSYVPDGSEYFMKKFRSVEFMGVFPKVDFEVGFAVDNNDFTTFTDINIDGVALLTAGFNRPHHPCRCGVMQRGRSLSILMRSKNPNTFLGAGEVYDQFQLSDARVLWGYTARGVNTRTPTQVT